eukprot:jgi/Botrbrau1/22413/Bobra.0091s0018.1
MPANPQTPLLQPSEYQQEQIFEDDEVAEELESGLTGPPKDFQAILSDHPQHVIAFLQDNGLRKLAEFEVLVADFYPVTADNDFITLGAETPDLPDVEQTWRNQLSKLGARHRLDPHRPEGRSTMEVEAFVVAIENATATDNVGIVQPVLKRVAGGHSTMLLFALPAVQAVVDFKWTAFAGKLIWVQLAIYLVWLLGFTGFTWVFQDEDTSQSLPDIAHTGRGILGLALLSVSTLAMVPFLYIEVASYNDFGAAWFTFQNLLDVITYTLQIAVVFCYLGRLWVGDYYFTIILAVQCLLLWYRLQYYLRVFRATSRGAFIDSLKDVVADVRFYLLFMLFTLWGFAAAFHILYKKQQETFEEFSNMARSMWTLFNAAIGTYDEDTYLSSDAPYGAIPFFILYTFVISIILFNLLITLLMDAYQQKTGNSGLRDVQNRAEICDELEQALPEWIKRRKRRAWFPKFVHVLKAKDDARMEVKPSPLWGASDLLDPVEALSMKVDELSEKLDRLLAVKQSFRRLPGFTSLPASTRLPASTSLRAS